MTKRNKYQASSDKMYRLRVKLKSRLKKTPEDDTKARESLSYRIELLNVIRGEMKVLIRELSN